MIRRAAGKNEEKRLCSPSGAKSFGAALNEVGPVPAAEVLHNHGNRARESVRGPLSCDRRWMLSAESRGVGAPLLHPIVSGLSGEGLNEPDLSTGHV